LRTALAAALLNAEMIKQVAVESVRTTLQATGDADIA
jgi:hypothetical protein